MAAPTPAELQAQITELGEKLEVNALEANVFYLLWAGALVFLMQAGFATLSAGCVRAVNVKNILMYTLVDATLGGVMWFVVGYGFAYDDGKDPLQPTNPFIGSTPGNFALSGAEDGFGSDWINWYFQYAFAAAAASIAVGAITERTEVAAYLVITAFVTGFIYPVAVHWVWDPAGFLSSSNPGAVLLGSIDFAGSGVVHITGGFIGLTGALIVGPRLGRWERPNDFEPHSAPLIIIGTFLLWFGWYGFNPGSTLQLHGATTDMARVAVCTTLSPAAACITGLLLKKNLPKVLGGSGLWDLPFMCNALLTGLVSITAGCSVVMPWAAVVIGVVGGMVYLGASALVKKCKIDDPLDAGAVHGFGGIWGMLAVGFFAEPGYSYAPADSSSYFIPGSGQFQGNALQGNAHWNAGCFRGGNGMLLGSQIVVVIIEICWAIGTSFFLFMALKLLGVLRVKPEDEEVGLDNSKHGGQSFGGLSTSERGYAANAVQAEPVDRKSVV